MNTKAFALAAVMFTVICSLVGLAVWFPIEAACTILCAFGIVVMIFLAWISYEISRHILGKDQNQ